MPKLFDDSVYCTLLDVHNKSKTAQTHPVYLPINGLLLHAFMLAVKPSQCLWEVTMIPEKGEGRQQNCSLWPWDIIFKTYVWKDRDTLATFMSFLFMTHSFCSFSIALHHTSPLSEGKKLQDQPSSSPRKAGEGGGRCRRWKAYCFRVGFPPDTASNFSLKVSKCCS